VPHGDNTPIVTPSSLQIALGITAVATLVLGILPGVVLHFGDIANLVGAFGG
jgi:alkylated DNA nucleotide flippase Atl1